MNMLCESVSLDTVMNEPYFKHFSDVLLYRGVRSSYDEITEMPFKLRTKPLDSAKFIHDAINDESESRFGLPIRNLMFSYTEEEQAQGYGKVVVIVPKGDNFKLFYNYEIEDLTAQYMLKPDSVYERMWDDALQDYSNMDFSNEIAGDNWELEEVIELAIEDVQFETEQLLKELYSHLTKTLPSKLQLVADKHDIDRERLEQLHTIIENDDIPEQVTARFKDMMVYFVERIVTEYLDGVEEVDDQDDMDLSTRPEIMIYAPDGFYVVPLELMK